MKKLSFLLAFVLLFSFCLGGCGQPQPNSRLDDLNKLCDTLEKNHYNLYANVSEEEFQAEREKIARQTAKMTDEEFYWSVCHLVSLVGDAHTMVGNTGEPFMTALLWSIKKFDEGWYILKLDQKNEQYLGMRVTAINDLPIDEAVERARQVVSYETDSWFWNLVPQTLAWRGALEYLEIVEEGEPVTVTVETQDGAEQSFELTATDNWDERSQMVSFQREAVPETGYQNNYYWSAELDEDTYFIQYNVCAGGDPSMPEFAQQVLADLENGYQNIIFDLRYNNGGNDQIILPLKNAVVNARNKQGEKCHLYVLTGWNTFSAGVDAAAGFQTSNAENTTFVGQPTGGSLQTGGNLLEISMDSVPFSVTCALDYFVILGQKGSLVPDYIVPQTFEQYAKGEDPEIQYLYDNLL